MQSLTETEKTEHHSEETKDVEEDESLKLPSVASTNTAAKFVAGGVSCMIISFVLNPCDVVKVRLQLQNQLQKTAGITFHSGDVPYKGFFHAAGKIWSEEGYFRGLMKGITASMLREATYSSVRMGFYDPVKNFLAPNANSKDDFTLLQKIMAGAISGATGAAFANPTDLIKIRFQSVTPTDRKPYKNTFDAFYQIYATEGGIKALYKGIGPTTVRAAVLTGAQLSSYDHSKRILLRNGFEDSFAVHLTASIISGLVTTTATNPVDIVKTRWMTDKSLYANPIDCFIKTIKMEGAHALWKGWLPNYFRLGPHFILSLPLYEQLRKLMGADTL